MSEQHSEREERRVLTAEDIVSMKQVSGAKISPDGKWAVFVRSVPVLEKEKSEYRGHIWLVSTDEGQPLQLTNGPNGDSSPEWSPDSTRIAFVSKRNGDKNQIWVVPIAGGEARQLTYAENGAGGPLWSPDGRQIAFLMQEKDSDEQEKRKKAKDDPVTVEKDDFKQTCLWVVDVDSMDAEPELVFDLGEESKDKEEEKGEKPRDKKDTSVRLTEADSHATAPQWSPDSKQVAFVSAPSPKADHGMFDAAIQILDIETKEIRKLTSNPGGEYSPRWSPDGKRIAFAYRTDDANKLQQDIYVIPAEGGESQNLTASLDRHENNPVWSADGSQIYFETADGVRRRLYSVSVSDGNIHPIAATEPIVTGLTLADDGDRFVSYRTTPNGPTDLWIESLVTGESRHLTQLNPQLTEVTFGETQVIQWNSSDGLEVEGVLWLPVDYEEGTIYPLLAVPHGGPHGAVGLGFNTLSHFFAANGFVVFAPNFRGSDGYGAEFARGNYANWGDGDYQDMMTGVDFLIAEGIADPERLVIGGWSYGGYMTAWTVSQTDRFQAACMGAGLSNLVSMYAQNDIRRFMNIYFDDGSPYEEMQLYRDRSPISYIHQAKTPTLILHGAEDKRVPVPQAEEFYAGLKAIGVEVEFVKYPREGHGLGEPRHQMDRLKRQLAWYQEHLP